MKLNMESEFLPKNPNCRSKLMIFINEMFFFAIFEIQAQVKTGAEGYRKGDIYSLGVILWELLRRQSLANYLGVKEESEVRRTILQGYNNNITGHTSSSSKVETSISQILFWPRALALLSEETYIQSSEGSKAGWATQLGQIRDCIADSLRFEPDARPDIKSVRQRLRPLHKGM